MIYIFRNIKCINNAIKNGCRKSYIKNIYHEIEISLNKLQAISILQGKLKKYTQSKCLENILELNMKHIEENSIEYRTTRDKRKLSCNLNPDVCEINIKLEESRLEKLKMELNEKINLYNNDLSVVKN